MTHTDIQVTPTPRAGRPRITPRVVIWGVVLLALAAGLMPSPYAVQEPGPVLNTLGEIEVGGEVRSVIEIEGAETTESDGVLNMLTVRILGHPDAPIRLIDLVPSLVRPGTEIVPLDLLYPSGQTTQQRDEHNQVLMENSQHVATVAALRALGDSVDTRVSIHQVVSDGPADGLLQPGDVVRSIAGTQVNGSAHLRDIVGRSAPDMPLMFTVQRGDETINIEVTPTWVPAEQRSIIGVTVVADYDLPISVDIALDRTGGPSAGLVFTLAIIEELTEHEIVGDLRVSATGTVQDDGAVGAVGGIPSKLEAARQSGSDLFLMPVANCSNLPNRLPDTVKVAPVASVAEALEVIENAREGRTVVGIERCER